MNTELKAIVDAAQAQGACVAGLDKIREFETVEQAMASQYGPFLATWYAMKVVKARCPELEAGIQRNNYCWSMYRLMFKF